MHEYKRLIWPWRCCAALPAVACVCVSAFVCVWGTAFAVDICCIASRSPQQIYSGASTHPGPYTGHAIPSCPDVCGRLCQPAPAPRSAGKRSRCAQLQAENEGGGGGKDGLPVLDPYLGSLLTVSDPKRRRVWLQKNPLRWMRGRHRAESHSERNIHMGTSERGKWRADEQGAGGGVVCASVAVLLLPVTLASRSVAADPWRDASVMIASPILRTRLRLDRPSQQLGGARRTL